MAQTIYCDTSELKKLVKNAKGILEDGTIRRELAGGLNDTLPHIAAETKRQVKAEYYVTKSINKTLEKKKASAGDLTAEARYTDSPLPLFVFKNRAPNNRYRSPVTVTVKRSNGAQTHTGSSPAMFRAYGKKIKLRDGGQRNIRGAYTVSIPQMVSNDKVYEEIAKDAEKYLYKKVEYRLEKRMSKL